MPRKLTLFILVASLALGLAACATNPPIQQIGLSEYTLYRVDHAGVFGNATDLRNSVLADANAFAAAQGKIAVPVAAKSHPVGILGDFASFQYTFRLANKSDKAAAEIHLLPGTDVVVDGNGKILDGKVDAKGATAAPAGDRVDRIAADLAKLQKLRADGVITQAEFEAQRTRVLSEP